MASNAPPLRPMPTRLGRYEVRAKIGEGGMATVYLGFDASAGPDRVVALKVIKDEFSLNPEFVNMFHDEAKIVSRLNHPNVVRVHELGTEGSRLFIAMELLFGQSLWQVWNACRAHGVRLRYDVAAWIAARCAEGLHHAHELRGEGGAPSDLVHRDVNPSNIFVTYAGEVKIIDFGLAKAIGRVSKTAAGVVKGKLAYLSPEQAMGRPLDRRSDVFALGTTLWEVTVDQRLFKASDDFETLKKVHAAQVPDPCAIVDGYPPRLWSLVQRALARDPGDRYATAADFARELDVFARGEGRDVGPRVVADIMQALFANERARQATWITEASRPDRPAPRDPLVSNALPKVGQSIPAPAPPAKDDLEGGLFSGPAVTLRDPQLAARQAATVPPAGEAPRAPAPPPASPAAQAGQEVRGGGAPAAHPTAPPTVPNGVAAAVVAGVVTLGVVGAIVAWVLAH